MTPLQGDVMEDASSHINHMQVHLTVVGDVWIVGVGLYLILGVWDHSSGMEPLVWVGRGEGVRSHLMSKSYVRITRKRV